MKKLLITLTILLSSTLFVQANEMYDKEAMIEIDICRAKGTSECFENIFYKADNDWARLNYGVALLKEKRIDDAKIEFQNIINNSSNGQIVTQAQSFLTKIEKLEEEMRYADYADEGNYLSDLMVTSRWQYPNRLKIYIYEYTGNEYLFEEAFSIWNDAVSDLGFSFVDSPEKADIECYFVNGFSGNHVGLTSFRKRIINGKSYFVPPVSVKIAQQDSSGRKFTENELLSIILHELGHAFGISGHSKNKNDIMYYSTETYQNTNISDRDVNTLKEIYK